MALPLIPFLTGAVVGAVAAFVYKDENAKKKISEGTTAAANKITATVSSGTEKVKNAVSRKKSDAEEQELPAENSEAAPA